LLSHDDTEGLSLRFYHIIGIGGGCELRLLYAIKT